MASVWRWYGVLIVVAATMSLTLILALGKDHPRAETLLHLWGFGGLLLMLFVGGSLATTKPN